VTSGNDLGSAPSLGQLIGDRLSGDPGCPRAAIAICRRARGSGTRNARSKMPDSMSDFRVTSHMTTGRTINALTARSDEPREAAPRFADGSVWTTTKPRHDCAQPVGGLAPWQLRRAQEMLLANIESNLRLGHVAKACGLSTSHFARAFKISTGVSPLKWFIGLRIDLSRRTLTQSDISLVDVAGMYGISDQSRFSRVFRRVVGRSPGAWRRECRDDSRFAEPSYTVAWVDFIPARSGRRDS
jgi:AraC-like DNA-binding protein